MFSFLPHKNVPDILKYEGKHPTTLNIAIIDQKYVVCVLLNSLCKSYKNRLRSRMSCEGPTILGRIIILLWKGLLQYSRATEVISKVLMQFATFAFVRES